MRGCSLGQLQVGFSNERWKPGEIRKLCTTLKCEQMLYKLLFHSTHFLSIPSPKYILISGITHLPQYQLGLIRNSLAQDIWYGFVDDLEKLFPVDKRRKSKWIPSRKLWTHSTEQHLLVLQLKLHKDLGAPSKSKSHAWGNLS